MMSNVVRCCVLFSLACSAAAGGTRLSQEVADHAESAANPIRRVVTMLQMMAKKVEAEGEKEKELYEKFVCYCKSSNGALSKSIADNDAKVPQLQSDIEEAESKLALTKEELAKAQADRDAAKEAMAKATAIREKEHAAFLKEKGESDANIDALNRAIPAIEKGMSGGFLQTNAAALLRRITINDVDLTDYDRETLAAFLQGGSGESEDYAPASGEIVGILKQMRDTMGKDLSELIAQEDAAKAAYDGLMAAKTKEVDTLQAAIERKIKLIGEIGVEIVQMKEDLSDSEEALIEDKKFLADLDKNCAAKAKEWEERKKTRSMELQALAETIKILNDDDALELFKKTLPTPSLLQVQSRMDQVRRRALAIVKKATGRRPEVELIALALSGKKIDFSKVIKMIDDMVALLGKEQQDDNNKKEYCEKELDFTEDKIKELSRAVSDLEKTIADKESQIQTLGDEIKALEEGIKALDKAVAQATEQRKEENAEYTDLMAGNSAAIQLIEFAKNRMNKFYNPKLYKPPPKRELSEEERITLNMGGTLAPTNPPAGIAGTGISALDTAHREAPAPPPETFGAYSKKSEESNGVISMMDLLIKDLNKEITEGSVEEKNAQEEYEQLMSDSSAKRAEDTKSITDKEGAKADTEADLVTAKSDKESTTDELMATKKFESQLHVDCDWLLQNFQLRKESRAAEVDALKNAKAVLSGADFSFMQMSVQPHQH